MLSNADEPVAASRQEKEEARDYVLLPLSFPSGGKQLEEAILDEIEKASRQRLRSLEEVNGFIDDISATMNLNLAYLPGETVRIKSGPFINFTGKVKEVYDDASRLKVAVTIFGRQVMSELGFVDVEKTGFSRPRARNLKLIIAIDNLEQWIEREPGFDDQLSKFIAQHSHLSHIYWLITLHDASYDRVSTNSIWRRYSIVYPITDAALQKKSYWPNIDGWLVLDEFNLAERFGLKIIQAKQQPEDAEESAHPIPVRELETYDENSPTVRYLSNPFLAWITLDMLGDLKGRVFDLHFIEFITHFWDKRRASLNPGPSMSENQLKQAIELMARILPGLSNLSISLPALLDKLTEEAVAFNYEIKNRELATQAVRILLKNNLLRRVGRSQSSLPGLSETESVEMGLEIFWEYYIATEFQKILALQEASPQQEAQTIWQKLQTIWRREGVGEGVAIFLLLMLDKKRAEDESSAGLIAELLRLAVDSQGSLASAIWFAGAKISPDTQRLLTEVSLERRRSFLEERRALFAYLSFISEASPEAMDAEKRLELLQPYYR
ncbi:MAG TPA: KOW motif-containing protein, partial [Pyrinomonadaceae bacterium]